MDDELLSTTWLSIKEGAVDLTIAQQEDVLELFKLSSMTDAEQVDYKLNKLGL